MDMGACACAPGEQGVDTASVLTDLGATRDTLRRGQGRRAKKSNNPEASTQCRTVDTGTQTDSSFASGCDESILQGVVERVVQPFATQLASVEAQQSLLPEGLATAESSVAVAAEFGRIRSHGDPARLGPGPRDA